MKLSVGRFHHLVRYFVVFGIISFTGYVMEWVEKLFLLLCGPSLFVAYQVKAFVTKYLPQIPNTPTTDHYAFLMPIVVIYYGVMGFLIKQLWNEKGLMRTVSLLCFVGFIGYIHLTTWKYLKAFWDAPF